MTAISDYLDSLEDPDIYRPIIEKPSLSQYDNYQIYSLALIDYPYQYEYFESNLSATGFSGSSNTSLYGMSTKHFKVIAPYTVSEFAGYASNMLAYQQFDPKGRIPVDFRSIIESCYLTPRNLYIYQTGRIENIPNGEVSGYVTKANFDPQLQPDYDAQREAILRTEVELLNNNLDIEAFIELYEFKYFAGMSGGYQEYDFRRVTAKQVFYNQLGVSVPIPSFISLVTTYSLDTRIRPPNSPVINPDLSGLITIGYYRKNGLEAIPETTTIDWLTYEFQLKAGINCAIPIIDPTFGTLVFQGNDDLVAEVKLKLSAIALSGNSYRYSDYYFRSGLTPSVWDEWRSLYQSQYMVERPDDSEEIRIKYYSEYREPIIRILAANNDYANNDSNNYLDLNYLQTHPMFTVNNTRSRNWHLAPQTEGIGTLIMDSPRTIEIHKALNAAKYSRNELNPTEERFTNLGHLIEKVAFLLGYRPEPDGSFNPETEKARVKRIIPSKQQIDKTKIGVNNFGVAGMLLKMIGNRFKGKEIVSDECVVIQDIPQLFGHVLDTINLGLGLQESSAIEINNEAGTARYNNQLEVLIELVNIAKANQEMLRAALTSSLVTQGQTSEIIGGLGLPSLTKTLPIVIDGKNKQLPYKGISPHRSISQEIATCTYNVGLVTGHLI